MKGVVDLEKLALVIDHQPLIRNLIANLLSIREISSNQAASHEEAIRLLSEYDYHLVFVDLMMPHENGFAVLNDIGARWPDRTQHTVVTTSSDPKFLSRVPRTGWCAVLVKPFAISEFFRITDMCLGGNHVAGLCYN